MTQPPEPTDEAGAESQPPEPTDEAGAESQPTEPTEDAGPESQPVEGVDTGAPSRWSTLRGRITQSQTQLEAKYEEAQARRGESTSIDVAFRVFEADRRFAGGLIAGGMAFRIFVVLVPFAFVVVTAFGFVGEWVDTHNPTEVARQLGMTGLLATAIKSSAGASTAERIAALLIGLYALLWTTWSLIRALRTVHGLVWDLPSLPRLVRPWRPTLWVVAGMLVLFFAGTAASRVSDVSPLGEIVLRLLFLVVVAAAWVGVSWWLPRAPETTWKSLVPGAVLVAVGVEVLQFLTVYFFSRYIVNKTDTYGAIGASIAILLWADLLGRLIVTSAFVNAARWNRRIEESGSPPPVEDSATGVPPKSPSP